MAFSYSDKNFTVIGNLCFVHILIENKTATYFIPTAFANRMLITDEFKVPYFSYDGLHTSIGTATVSEGSISCVGQNNHGYLIFYFPIDSNK